MNTNNQLGPSQTTTHDKEAELDRLNQEIAAKRAELDALNNGAEENVVNRHDIEQPAIEEDFAKQKTVPNEQHERVDESINQYDDPDEYYDEYYPEDVPLSALQCIVKFLQGAVGIALVVWIVWLAGSGTLNFYVTKMLPEKMYQDTQFWESVTDGLDKDFLIDTYGVKFTVIKEPKFDSKWVNKVQRFKQGSIEYKLISDHSVGLNGKRLYHYSMTIPIGYDAYQPVNGNVARGVAFIEVSANIEMASKGKVEWVVTNIIYDRLPDTPGEYPGEFGSYEYSEGYTTNIRTDGDYSYNYYDEPIDPEEALDNAINYLQNNRGDYEEDYDLSYLDQYEPH